VPHAPHDLEGIGAPVDPERGGRVAHLMKREWFALDAIPAAKVADVQIRHLKLSPRRNHRGSAR
jgi:hypothetical protein